MNAMDKKFKELLENIKSQVFDVITEMNRDDRE